MRGGRYPRGEVVSRRVMGGQTTDGNGAYISSRIRGYSIDGETPLSGRFLSAAVLSVMSQYADLQV